jgi:hypothetical protein
MHCIAQTLLTAVVISVTAMGQTSPRPAAAQGTAKGDSAMPPAAGIDMAAGRSSPAADTGAGRTVGGASVRAAGPGSGHAPDSAQATLRKATFDSLEQIKSAQLQWHMAYPSSLDSVFAPDVIGPYRIMNDNAAGLSEVLRASPLSVAVPYALSNSQSRFMLFGFPLLTNAVYTDGNVFGDVPDAEHGTDGVLATRVNEATVLPPLGVQCSGEPFRLVAPHTDVMWENGVFRENLLGVRFVRPVTKTIDAGIYSNFRSLAPYNFSTANDIKSLYNYFFQDTTLLANGGRNPLSNENEMTLAVTSHQSNTAGSSASYSYVDSKNDQAVQLHDSTANTESLHWRTISRYANIFQGNTRGLSLSSVASVNIDARAVIEGHRLYTPIVNSALTQEDVGRNTELCLAIEPYAAFGTDTLSVSGRAVRKDQLLYNGAEPVATIGDVRFGFRNGSTWGPLYASLALSAGDGAVKPAGERLRHDLVYSASGAMAVGMQRVRVFALRDHLPFVLPYDSLSAPLESYDDVYEAYGTDVFVGYDKIGLAAGVCAVSGVDTSTSGRFWSDNMMPYRQPSFSLMLTPLFGRVHGFALSSRMMLSDRRPSIKSQTSLSYQADPIFGKEHITADLVYDYWSGRETLTYAGISTWNREINNLSLVTGVHIQGFCLFYKIDNILNRKFAYVPGYFMPGITFRWGFQWLIPG